MTHLRHLIGFLLATLAIAPSWAQTAEDLARLDPGELYYQAYSLVKEAEELEKKEDFVKAFTKYRKARSFFDIIKITKPEFRKEGLAFRSGEATKGMERIHEKALAQQKARQDAGGTPLLEIPGEAKPRLEVPSEIDPTGSSTRQIQDLQKEILRLKGELSRLPNQRNASAARLRQQIRDTEAQLTRLAATPLQDDVIELNRQIEQLRRERDAISLAMNRARDEAARKQALTTRRLEAALDALAEATAEQKRLEAVNAKQTKINGQVVEGQQKQIDDLKKTIEEQNGIIAEVRQTASDLRKQLDQSQTMVAELKLERDGLVEERDRMKAALNLDEDSRIQQLITQNVALSKEFNQAQANLKAVQEEADSKREVILLAKQQLVVAKAKIENLRESNTKATLRMEKLEKSLKLAEDDLLAQLNGGKLNQRGRAEVSMLRGVVAKQMTKIQAQKGMAKLLLEEATRMGEIDPKLKDAMAQIEGDRKTELTIEELELIERTTANPNLNNNFRPTAGELQQGTTALRELTRDLNQVAKRLFVKGDFQAARGNLQLIVDEDPGAWEAMMNLGIVHLRLQDSAAAESQFRRSILIAGDRKIPFAHFMLGDALVRQNLYDDAAEELRRSLSLEPENPEAHILLGIIGGKTGNITEAEFHFKEAIAQNPNLYEPYFNLSIIYRSQGKKDLAKKYYTDYLRRGGPANLMHEKQIGV